MMNSRSSMFKVVLLAMILQATALAQTHQQPVTANICEVVESPDGYNEKVLTVEGILLPSEHSLALYSPSCKPKEGFNVTIQAVLPPAWESLPNGKQLRKLLHHGKSARVTLTGVFENGGYSYGPDAAKFRFVISEISSVGNAPGAPIAGTSHNATQSVYEAAAAPAEATTR